MLKYRDLSALSFASGVFKVDYICYFWNKSFDALSTSRFVTNVIKHMMSHVWLEYQA